MKSSLKLLEELGYAFVPHEGRNGGEIRNSANDAIVSLDVTEVRAWICGLRHALSGQTSCMHVPTPAKTQASHNEAFGSHQANPVESCPWCIVARKERELEALRKMVARLDPAPKGTKRG